MMSQGIEKNIQKIISSMQPGKLAYESKRAERAGMTLVEWIKEKEYKNLIGWVLNKREDKMDQILIEIS